VRILYHLFNQARGSQLPPSRPRSEHPRQRKYSTTRRHW